MDDSVLNDFKQDRIKLTIGVMDGTGKTVAFEKEDPQASIPSDDRIKRIQENYEDIAITLSNILENRSGVDQAFEFGKTVLERRESNSDIERKHIFDIVDFTGVTPREAEAYVKFAEAYPEGDYPRNIEARIAAALIDYHGEDEGKQIINQITESEYTLTKTVGRIWYDTDLFDLDTICLKALNSKAKDRVKTVRLVYLLEDRTPPSETEIERALSESTSEATATQTQSNRLQMHRTENTQSTPNTDSETPSEMKQTEQTADPVKTVKDRMNSIAEKHTGLDEKWQIGNAFLELKDELGLSYTEIAESSPLDKSKSGYNNMRRFAEVYDFAEYPENITIQAVYSLSLEFESYPDLRTRIETATSGTDVSINKGVVGIVRDSDSVSLSDLVDQVTGYTDVEVIQRTRMVYQLLGETPPAIDAVCDELDIPVPDEISTDSDSGSATHTETTDASDGDETDVDDEGSTAPSDSVSDTGSADGQMKGKAAFERDIAGIALQTDYIMTIIDDSSIQYDQESKTLITHDPIYRDVLTMEHGPALPSTAVLRYLSQYDTLTVFAAPDWGWAQTLRDCQIDITKISMGNPEPQKYTVEQSSTEPDTTETPYTLRNHTEDPLFICWPDGEQDRAALAVQTYVQNGGDTVLYLGETLGGESVSTELYEVLTTQFDHVESIETIQWEGHSDALHVFSKAE